MPNSKRKQKQIDRILDNKSEADIDGRYLYAVGYKKSGAATVVWNYIFAVTLDSAIRYARTQTKRDIYGISRHPFLRTDGRSYLFNGISGLWTVYDDKVIKLSDKTPRV